VCGYSTQPFYHMACSQTMLCSTSVFGINTRSVIFHASCLEKQGVKCAFFEKNVGFHSLECVLDLVFAMFFVILWVEVANFVVCRNC
jgi:hypothetical protein